MVPSARYRCEEWPWLGQWLVSVPRLRPCLAVAERVLEPGLRGAAGPLGVREREERPVPLEFKMIPEKLTADWE